MLGNLQVYLGPSHLDEYGAALRKVPELLWAARLVLLSSAVLHIWSAYALTRMNHAARPQGYRERENVASTLASRTMRWSGVFLLVFIVYHLLHFTFGTVHPNFIEGRVGHNFVTGFQVWWVSLFYIVAMIFLGLHMYHGGWSMMQTLGLNHPRYNYLRYVFAAVVAAIVVIGNISFPVAVLTGIVSERGSTAPRAVALHGPSSPTTVEPAR
jgi:succinate dehydrogenase / fumarate reductase cytochrome b subunit